MPREIPKALKKIRAAHMLKVYATGSALYLAAIAMVVCSLYLFHHVGGPPLFMAVLLMSLSNTIARKTSTWVEHKERVAKIATSILTGEYDNSEERK